MNKNDYSERYIEKEVIGRGHFGLIITIIKLF